MRYLIPMAAEDDLFPRSEFHFPKPLIEIDGQPMISHVIDRLQKADAEAEFVFVLRAQDCAEFSLDSVIELATDGRCTIVQLSRPTGGAVCSALMAIDYIDDDRPLVLVNGDQVIEPHQVERALKHFTSERAEVGAITFPSLHPRWSFLEVSDAGDILEAAEKRVISRDAIAGFYYFERGSDFVAAAKATIANGRSVGGRYFISTTINEMILLGKKALRFRIRAEDYDSFYSPQRLDHYQQRKQGQRIAAQFRGGGVKDAVQIVIPMAGLGSRFAAAGYDKPKPFIDVAGKTMIERVMDNLATPNARYVLVARTEHLEIEAETVRRLEAMGDICFVGLDKVTEGAACTVLTARRVLNPDLPLLIANCDQIVDFDCQTFLMDSIDRSLDGSILCFRDPKKDKKWSFAKTNKDGLVTEVQEKVPISDLATVGLYYFQYARNYVDAALDMIVANERVNNEFYVCPVYNYAIAHGGRYGVYKIPQSAMHGIGTPEDLSTFLARKPYG